MATFLVDTFTDTDSTAIASHTGETGATWTKHTLSDVGSAGVVTANRARSSGAGDLAGFWYSSGVPQSPDYDVVAIVRRLTTFATVAAVLGRFDTAALTGYRFSANNYGSAWILTKFVAGVQTDMGGTYTGDFALTTDYTMKLEMRGSTINCYVNGILRITTVDSAVTATGRAGIELQDSGAAGTDGWQIDSISASDVSPIPIAEPHKAFGPF